MLNVKKKVLIPDFFFNSKILVFIKIASQVAILNVEHCGFLHLVAY